MSKLLRIDRLTAPPIVGRRYLVPCVRSRWTNGENLYWLPVIGPKHDDKEILDFPREHWHYDWRFMPPHLYYDAGDFRMGKVHIAECVAEGPVWKSRLCHRVDDEFPCIVLGHSADGGGSPIRFLIDLESAYSSAKLKCNVCPHRGFSLNGITVREGMVVCPGHGLRWNVKTGELAPRLVNQPEGLAS